MERQILLIENNIYSNKEIIAVIETHQYENNIKIVHSYEEAKTILSTNIFNVVIFNILICNDEVFEIIKQVRNKSNDCKILILKNATNIEKLYSIYEAGANLVLVRPINQVMFETAFNSIINIYKDVFPINNFKLSYKKFDRLSRMETILNSLGINSETKGYKVLTEAILNAMDNKELKNNITTKLYPILASKFQTTANIIEHKIRDCIENVWRKGKFRNINSKLNIQFFSSLQKPSNAEFINLIAEKVC